MAEEFLLSQKYIDFYKNEASMEWLEGTTSSGKTTTAIPKFMFKVADSSKKLHIISGLDLGTIEKNIINKDLGIIDVFGSLVEYNPTGKGKHSLPHIIYKPKKGIEKVIYVLGYDTKARWKKALGGQYGCLYIDEANIANMEFVREASMRSDYVLGTLNPDDPSLEIYKEYVNHSRPLDKYAKDVPQEISELLIEEPKDNWTYWFFSFDDNPGLSEEKKQKIIENVPKGTKLWKNKIQGLRGRATGLVFSGFERKRNVIGKKDLYTKEGNLKYRFKFFTVGIDTAYSEGSPDTIALIFIGITECGKCIVLDEEVYNNADLTIPLAPSDVVLRIIAFADKNRTAWGFSRDMFLDSADQATRMEWLKYKRNKGSIYNIENAWKKTPIIERLHMMIGWIQKGHYLVVDHCINHIGELEKYSWKESKYEPDDGNDHTINGSQYGWLPFKQLIGIKED